MVETSNQNEQELIKTIIEEGQNVEGSILIGGFDLPGRYIEGYDPKKKVNATRISDPAFKSAEAIQFAQTAFPLMNTSEVMGASVDSFYSDGLTKYLGLISQGPVSATREKKIETYCAYFSRNVSYRGCKVQGNLKVGGFVSPSFSDERYGQQDYPTLSSDHQALPGLSYLKYLVGASALDFLQVSSHSFPTYHSTSYGVSVDTHQIAQWNPQVKFYNLFACSAGYLGPEVNLAQTYLLGTSSTLGVYASTKEGSIENPKVIYDDLKAGFSFGAALIRYLRDRFDESENYRYELDRNSGIVFYGDPTLKLHHCVESK